MASKLGADVDKLTWEAGVSTVGDGLMGAASSLLIASLTRDPLLVATLVMMAGVINRVTSNRTIRAAKGGRPR